QTLCLQSLMLMSSRCKQPNTPLFPYTTLFRSLERALEDHDVVAQHPNRIVAPDDALGDQAAGDDPELARAEHLAYLGHSHDLLLDRKSTRLNSSHVSISYAVFCLKKKKCFRFS